MDKYRKLSFEVIAAQGTDAENEACERYRKLLKEVGASEDAIRQSNDELVNFAKTFVISIPQHLTD